MKKIKINLDLLLPEIPDERDQCVDRIIKRIEHHKGIEKVHLVPANDLNKAQLCFHYDPDNISLETLQQIAENEGAEITRRYQHLFVDVNGILEMSQAGILEERLKKIPGIASVSVSSAGPVRLEYDSSEADKKDILRQIEKKWI